MFWKDLKKGIGAYKKGIQLISTLKLWKFFLIPALIGLLIGAGIIYLGYSLSDNIGAYLSSWYPFEFGASFISWIGNFLGAALIIIFGYILYKHLVLALSAPFMSPISEKIEAHLKGNNAVKSKMGFVGLLVRGIRLAIRNILLELTLTIPLLLLSWIPVINIITAALLVAVQAYFVGFGNMDYTLERHKKYSETAPFVRKNKGLAFGNGLVFILSLLIPVLGIMLTLPISTAAATITTINRISERA